MTHKWWAWFPIDAYVDELGEKKRETFLRTNSTLDAQRKRSYVHEMWKKNQNFGLV